MLTHLLHFHIRGASGSTAVSEATYGWAQGHFLGAYLGGGAGGGAPALGEFNGGWAQGHFLGPYLGSGADTGGAAPESFNGGWAQGSWLAYYYGAGAGGEEDTGRSPWWSTWRDHTGWYDTDTPSLAELVLAGQQTFIQARTGEDVPAVIPDEPDAEELLLDAYGYEGIARYSRGMEISYDEAESVVRWMAREERKAIIEWRESLIDQENLIILLAMMED